MQSSPNPAVTTLSLEGKLHSSTEEAIKNGLKRRFIYTVEKHARGGAPKFPGGGDTCYSILNRSSRGSGQAVQPTIVLRTDDG